MLNNQKSKNHLGYFDHSSYLKKRGIWCSPLLAKIFLCSLCFSSTSSFLMSASSTLPSSNILATVMRYSIFTYNQPKQHLNTLLCRGFQKKQAIRSARHLAIDSPLVWTQPCICWGQQRFKFKSQLIHFHCKPGEAIVKGVVLRLRVCRVVQIQ